VKVLKRNKKMLLSIVSAAAALGLVMFLAFGNAAEHTESAVGPTMQDVVNSKAASPPANFTRGEALNIINDVQLTKLTEVIKGTQSNPTDVHTTIQDGNGNVTLILYNAAKGDRDHIAATLRNAGLSPITVNTFHLRGYSHCSFGVDCSAETIYRPIISGPGDVAKPVVDSAMTLKPSEAFSAAMKPDLNQDGYAASACYAYDSNDDSTYYCIATPLIWVR